MDMNRYLLKFYPHAPYSGEPSHDQKRLSADSDEDALLQATALLREKLESVTPLREQDEFKCWVVVYWHNTPVGSSYLALQSLRPLRGKKSKAQDRNFILIQLRHDARSFLSREMPGMRIHTVNKTISDLALTGMLDRYGNLSSGIFTEVAESGGILYVEDATALPERILELILSTFDQDYFEMRDKKAPKGKRKVPCKFQLALGIPFPDLETEAFIKAVQKATPNKQFEVLQL